MILSAKWKVRTCLNKVVDIEDVIPLIEEQLSHNGQVTFTPRGNSMLPMLRNNKDTVTLKSPILPLKKYDIAFYKRDSGQYVLHRVVKVNTNGYAMRGDNQLINEEGIEDRQIIAVLKSFTRKGKKYNLKDKGYVLYTKIWINTVVIRKGYRIIVKLFRKIKNIITGRSR